MEHTDTVHSRLAVAVTALAMLGTAVLGLTASAGAAIDPSASAVLAGALKPVMQSTLKKKVPGLVVVKVTCYVPMTSPTIAGKCTAKFKVTKYSLLGVYQTKAELSNKSMLKWSTTAVSCSDAKTHAKVEC